MHPTPIPDANIWDGATRQVIAPPGGDLTNPDIASVEALFDTSDLGPRCSMRIELDPGDLDKLRAGAAIWLSVLGGTIQPFSLMVADPEQPAPPTLEVTHTARVHADGLSESSFDAVVLGVAEGQEVVFVRGCIEALEKMLENAETRR